MAHRPRPRTQWEADLRSRLQGNAEHRNVALRERHPASGASGHELSPFDLDLRTVDLSPRRRATGLDRRLEDALGLTCGRPPIDVPHPPLPGHGIDRPYFGPVREATVQTPT